MLGRLDARGDLTALLVGMALTAAAVASTTRFGTPFAAGTVVALGLFVAATVCFLTVPHIAVAATIPLFASIPAIKVLAAYWVGPAKDAVTLAAALATALYVLQRDGRRTLEQADRIVLAAIGGLGVLYVINTGGLSSGTWHGEAWLHGVRLMAEPLLLLLAGMLLPWPRRTLDWAAASLLLTGCVVATYGLFQQVLGRGRLQELGYTYGEQVETIGSALRSFGTLDDSFAYAVFLLLSLVTAIFWMRRSLLSWACGLLIAAGIVVALVQTAAVIGSALFALWLVRVRRTAAGVILFAATLAAGVALTIAAAPATESKTVQAGPSTYVTLNGRTTAWATIFEDGSKVPLGLGVGAVGRASIRAQIGVTAVSGTPEHSKEGQIAVDSGYLAAVADVGLAGLALLVLLLGRMLVLARRATRLPGEVAGWLGLGYLTVLMLDALTRDSFTGFPTAYLGFLLVGITLAVAREAEQAQPTAVRAR